MTVSESLHIEDKNSILWVTLPGSIKRENTLQIQNRIKDALNETITRVFLDLTHLSNLYSVTVTLIMHVREILMKAGYEMYLINVSKRCMKQLVLMKLDTILNIYETEKDFILDKK